MSSCTTTIDDICDDGIRLVLDRLPLNNELRNVRILSKRFQIVAEELLITRQASIRKLKLFPNLGHVYSYVSGLVAHNIQEDPQLSLLELSDQLQKHSTILVGKIDDYSRKETIFPQFLPRFFINLTELILVLKLGDNFDLDQFLAPLASQLVFLTLFGNSVGCEPLSVNVISTMTSLRRLNLFNFDLGSIDVPKMTPVLARLEHLGLYNYIEPFVDAFTMAGSNIVTPFLLGLTPGVCTSLSLSQVTFPDTELAFLFENNPALLANLTSLHYSPQEDNIYQWSLGLTPKTLEILCKVSFSKLTLLQTSLGSICTFCPLFRLLPATIPALVELKLGQVSGKLDFNEISLELVKLTSDSFKILTLRCLDLFFKDSIYLDINQILSFRSFCPALEEINFVPKKKFVLVPNEDIDSPIDGLGTDEKILLGHFEELCRIWLKDAIKIEPTRETPIGPIREFKIEKWKEADYCRLGQLQAPLGVYEDKLRQLAVKENLYQFLEHMNNYCTVLKSEIDQWQGEEHDQLREELQRQIELVEKCAQKREKLQQVFENAEQMEKEGKAKEAAEKNIIGNGIKPFGRLFWLTLGQCFNRRSTFN